MIYEKVTGDINNDGIEDCVVICKGTDTNHIVIDEHGVKADRNRRGIIILFNKNGRYEMALRNLECFSSENEDGGVYMPPELSVEIKEQKLFFHFSHGRYGYWKYTFSSQDSDFYCTNYDESSNRGPVIESTTSINFITGEKIIKVNLNQNAQGEDEIFNKTQTTFKVTNLIRLAEVSDFDQLDMTIY